MKHLLMNKNSRVSRPTPPQALEFDVERTALGGFEGYAATWEVDGDGLKLEPGCFKKTLRERAGKIPVVVRHASTNHDSTVFTTVGFITEGYEDERGLYVKGEFIDEADAQWVRDRIKNDAVKFMSVGFLPLQYTVDESGIARCHEVKLSEITLTNVPADLGAEIVGVRSEDIPEEEPSEQDTQAQEPSDADTQEEGLSPAEEFAMECERAAISAELTLLQYGDIPEDIYNRDYFDEFEDLFEDF